MFKERAVILSKVFSEDCNSATQYADILCLMVKL